MAEFRTFDLNPAQVRNLTTSIAIAIAFFAFLYLSIAYSVVILIAELFLTIVIVAMFNLGSFFGGKNVFQNPTAVTAELILAIAIVFTINQFGLNTSTGLIVFGVAIFIILAIFFSFLSLTKSVKEYNNIFGGITIVEGSHREYIGLPKGKNITSEGKLIIYIVGSAISAIEFLIIFIYIFTNPLIVIGSILFLAFALGTIITGTYSDNRRILAYVLTSILIIFGIQQLALYGFIPQVTTPQSLLTYNTAVLTFIIIFAFTYLFTRSGIIKGEQTSSILKK